MTDKLHKIASKDTPLAEALSAAIHVVHAAEGSILLLNDAGKTLRFAVCCSPAADKLRGTAQPVSRGLVGLVVSFQQPTISNRVEDDPQHDKAVDQKVGSKTSSQMAVPLSDAEHEYGVLTAINSTREGGFSDDDLRAYVAAANTITQRLSALNTEAD